MPTLSIHTNAVTEDKEQALLQLSRLIAEMLNKPERYVMILLHDGLDMVFSGSSNIAAYMRLESLGLDEDKTKHYSEQLCNAMEKLFAIPADRIYIEFAAPPRHMFGWNRTTFA